MSKKRTVLIMGLGLHGGGAGAANFFISRGDRVVVTDLRTKKELEKGISRLRQREKIRFVFGRHDFKDFKQADLIIKNPGVPDNSPYIKYAKRYGVEIDTDIGIFLDHIRDLTPNIIGITGTKGKSTTAALIHRIVQEQHSDALLAGNITISVFDILHSIRKNTYVILELSSFQLGGISSKQYSPRIGVFTNFMEDHFNYYESAEDYYNDKSVLFSFQKKGDVLVLNRDDAVFNRVKVAQGAVPVSFGLGTEFSGNGTFIRDGKVYYRENDKIQTIINTSIVKLRGTHNLYNVLAAVSTACSEGIQPAMIQDAVSAFHGLEHRLEWVADRNNIHFYNDSAATTPEAAVEGIKSIGRQITLIAGGSDKGLHLQEFIHTIELEVENLVLLEGSGTQRLLQEGIKKPYRLFDNLGDAVHFAYKVTDPSETVLLSPGFASFGMFLNEFERGNQFKEIVNQLE